MITQEKAKILFEYDEGTGVLTRKPLPATSKTNKMYNTRFAGKTPTSKDSKGYLTVRAEGKTYRVARLIYLWMEGYFPDQVDHIDRDRTNNSWANLRAVDNQQNSWYRGKYNRGNTTSTYQGVSLHRKTNKWRAQISINEDKQHLGLFKTEQEAYETYKLKFLELTGNKL